MVPYNEVSDTPIRATKKSVKPKNPNRTVTEQSKFRQEVEGESEKGELPLSTSSIQPDDQRAINDITGVNTKIPKESRATDAHHIFGVESNPKLKSNPNNGIMLTRKEHREIETLNKGLLRKQAMLRLKLARIDDGGKTSGSYFLTPNGEHVGPLEQHADFISNNLGKKVDYDDESAYEEYFKKTGDIRIGHREGTKRNGQGSTNNVIYNTPTSAQMKALHQHEKDFPTDTHAHTYFLAGSGYEHGMNGGFNTARELRNHLSKNKLASIMSRIATFKQDIRHKNDMAANVLNLSADAIMNKFIEFKKNNDDFKSLTGTFDPLQGAIIDARVPAGAMRLQNIFGVKGKLAFNSITDTRQGPVTDLDLIRSQLKEIEQSGEVPSIGVFEGSIEATIALIDKTDDEILENLLESQRSTAIIDPDTRLRIVDNVSFRQN
jgi:hypothetical protein